MEGQISSGKYTLPNFAQHLHVMLVDFETTSLNKIKAKLEKFSYQVTGVNLASEALSMIGENKTRYKVVIANYRTLPKIDYGSFVRELWQKEIPLIWMSRSYDEAEQALHDGASFLLIEPISSKKLKHLWQFAFRRRSNHEAGGAFGSAARLDLPGIQNKQEVKIEQDNQRDKEKEFITTTNNQQEGSKHKRPIGDQQGNMQDKRTKFSLNQNERGREGHGNRNEKGSEPPVWNSVRRNNFEAAYRKLGVRATAKTIHEEMNDPGLTQKQVGSRLQKFKNSLQKKNVDSGPTSLPVTDNSSSSLARHPGIKNLPNFPPCANQDLDTDFAASSSTRHQTSGIATNPGNFPSNFGDGIQKPKPMVERPAAGLPNIPPNANQNQELTTNIAATFNSNCKNQLAAGVAITETLSSEQANIKNPGIATNSENVPTNFTHNQEPMGEQAPAVGSPRLPAYGNQNQDLSTIRAAPFSTIHQSQLQERAVAATTEPVGSVQGERTSGNVIEAENSLMNGSGGIQNQESTVEQGLADGSSNQNQSESEHAGIWTISEAETVGLHVIFDLLNQELMMEETLPGGSSNQNQLLSDLDDIFPPHDGKTGFEWCS